VHPNAHEVVIEALAYALTILSIFEDEQHANELLVQCKYDGRKLAPFLDQIEAQASAEDVTLVTGQRNAFKKVRGLPLTFDSFRAFFKGFNELEYRCPPSQHMTDHDLFHQLVGTLFIKDPNQRKNWSNHINQPEIINGAGARVGGPPRTLIESKLLGEKVLRSERVLANIDELSSPSGMVLSADMASLASTASSSGSAGMSAQQIYEALITDPCNSVCPFSTTYGMPRTAHSVAIGVSLRLAVSGPLSTKAFDTFCSCTSLRFCVRAVCSFFWS